MEHRETLLYQTPLKIHLHTFQDITVKQTFIYTTQVFLDALPDFHLHVVRTETLSGVSIFQDITNLYISDAFVCFELVFRRLQQSWQCKVSFSLLVVARAIA